MAEDLAHVWAVCAVSLASKLVERIYVVDEGSLLPVR